MTELAGRAGLEGRERLEVRLLGQFEVRLDGRLLELTSDRLRTLVAVLAVSVPQPVPAEALGERIWGEARPQHLRRSVHTLVARLRGAAGAEVVGTDPGGYVLHAVPERVDALRFCTLLTAAEQSGVPEDERRLVDEALALWRGTPFEGVRSDWLAQSQLPALVDRYLGAVERRIDMDLSAGRPAGLVAELRELTGRYPLRESLWERLLDVLDQAGRAAEALAAYEVVRSRLATELGVEPGPGLRALHGRLLAADAATAAAAVAPPAPRQLPPDTANFTGRAAEVAALDALLPGPSGPPGGPIVIAALDGIGGIGKTTLAVHWAHRVRDRFGDGQLYVNLRGYGPGEPMEPAAALDVLLRGLGEGPERIPAGLDARAALYRSLTADRRLLVVLDNARGVEQVRPLLPGSTCLVLVTSRSQLRGLVARDGAHRLDLDRLREAEAVALLHRMLPAPGPAPALLEDLAALCGYSPLALTIAAEHARRQPGRGARELVAEITAERHRLAAFDSDRDPAGGVRAVLSWSYRALDPDAARLFCLLGLQPGPDVGVPAVAALAGARRAATARVLQRLVDANLVQERRSGRYELHDLLRSYAAELVEQDVTAGDRTAATERLLGFYAHTANAARATVNPGRGLIEAGPVPDRVEPLDFADDTEALAWYELERQSLAAVVVHAADHGHDRGAAVLVRMLWELLFMRHDLKQWSGLQRLAVLSARRTGDAALEAVLTNQLAITLMDGDRPADAAEVLDRALELFEQVGDPRGQAMARTNLGLVHRRLGRLEASRQALESAVAYYAQASPGESHAVNNLALTYIALGRYDEALPLAQHANDVDRATGGQMQYARSLETLGQAYAGQGKYEDALATYEHALSSLRELGDHRTEAITLVHLGVAYRGSGRPDRARASWREALRVIDAEDLPDSWELRRADVVELLERGR